MNRGGLKLSSNTYNFSPSGTHNTEALLYKVLLLVSYKMRLEKPMMILA